MVIPTLIDMNMLSLNIIHSWLVSRNVLGVVMSYYQKYVFQKNQKTYVKALNMITNKNVAKTMTEHILCDCKSKFNSTACNSKQICNNKTCQYECNNLHKCEKDYSWNPSTCICEK